MQAARARVQGQAAAWLCSGRGHGHGQEPLRRWCSGGGRGAAADSPLRQLLDGAGSFGESAQPAAEPELQWATQPYAARTGARGGGGGREAVDPHEATVLLFPGQGSQRVGMGLRLAAVPAARDFYHFASEVVGWDVWRVCTAGPAAELEERCQTCVVVTALAGVERAREERPAALSRVRAVAGFSLGEVGALVFAGALHAADALRLVEVRQAAMRAAAAERRGGMLTAWLAADASLGAALAAARDHAAQRGLASPVCVVANYLYPGCKVLAGDEAALEFLEARGREWGVRRTARVRVHGAFHTPLMEAARGAVRAALDALGEEAVRAPRVRVVSATEGRALGSARSVRRALERGVVAPVRWEQTLQALYARPRGARFPLTLALGPGGALRASLRQVNARAWDDSLQVDV